MNSKHADWYREYRNGTTVRELAKHYRVHVQTIYSAFSRAERAADVGWVNKNVDEKLYEHVDTEAKAYVLGLIAADGYLNVNRIVLKLQARDRELLAKINTWFYRSPAKIRKDGKARVLCLYSNKVYARVLELLGPKKASRLRIPKELPDRFFRDFLRGFFDGDGTVGIRASRPLQRQISLCSIDQSFLQNIQQRLRASGVFGTLYSEVRKGKTMRMPQGVSVAKHDMHRLVFTTHDSRIALFEYLYSGATLYLDRKYKLFKSYYDNTVRRQQLKAAKLRNA